MRYPLILLFLCLPMPSFAQGDLTEDSIRAFYKQAVRVQLEGEAPTVEFLKTHTHEDAQITMNLITNFKGSPPQKQALKHSKKDVIKETRLGYSRSKLESIENTVLVIKIADDGRSAMVKDTTFAVFMLNVPMPNGIKLFHTEQSMLCDGEVLLSDAGVIQAKDSVCNVEATMVPVE